MSIGIESGFLLNFGWCPVNLTPAPLQPASFAKSQREIWLERGVKGEGAKPTLIISPPLQIIDSGLATLSNLERGTKGVRFVNITTNHE